MLDLGEWCDAFATEYLCVSLEGWTGWISPQFWEPVMMPTDEEIILRARWREKWRAYYPCPEKPITNSSDWVPRIIDEDKDDQAKT